MKKIRITFILALSSFLFTAHTFAQEISHFTTDQYKGGRSGGQYHYLEIKYHQGSHPNSSKYIQELLEGGYKAIELSVGTQSTGRQDWQRMHACPQYGLGFYLGDLGNSQADSIVGTPSGIFGYVGIPIWRIRKFMFMTDLAAGLSYDFNPYDAETNPYNDVIGSWMNVYFNINFNARWQVSDRIDLSIGYDLTHFSNGRWRTPNKGINLMGANFGIAYNFSPLNNYRKFVGDTAYYPIRPELIYEPAPKWEKYSEITIFGTIGTSTNSGPVENEAGPRFFNSSWGAEYARCFWNRGKVVLGTDIFYDGSLIDGYDKPHSEVTMLERMSFAAHVGHDFLIERITFMTQFGYYLYKESSERGSWFLRAGGRIALNDRWKVHICLKTMNGGIADWVEWGMAYSIRLNKKG